MPRNPPRPGAAPRACATRSRWPFALAAAALACLAGGDAARRLQSTPAAQAGVAAAVAGPVALIMARDVLAIGVPPATVPPQAPADTSSPVSVGVSLSISGNPRQPLEEPACTAIT